jgi:hypothetical protein
MSEDALAWGAALASLPPPPPRVSVELDGLSLGELLAALKFTGIVASNRDGAVVLHRAPKAVRP